MTGSGRVRRHVPARWTLRTQLVVTQVVLMATVSLVIGLVSVLFLNAFLLGQLDKQLANSSGRTQRAYNGDEEQQQSKTPPPDPCSTGVPPLPPGQGVGTISAMRCASSSVVAGLVSTDLHPQGEALTSPELTALTKASLLDGKAHSVDLGEELGSYRVMASKTPDGDVLITGLPLGGVYATMWRLTVVITAVALIGLLAVAFAGAAIVRWALRPLRRVAATARRVAQLPLDRGEVALAVRVPAGDTHSGTEVGQVGAALNRMLEHVASALTARQASEMRVRRFVADASHELRTPLASIRGYAELTRRSRGEVSPDVAHALARVESEAQRMTVLVEELLLLARLDEGRPLDREPVDLSRLVVDAVGDAHAAGRDHRWQLELPEEPVTVLGDQVRLHQVVANLLANARTHTPVGTTVSVSLSVDPVPGERPPDRPALQATLVVADDGPGVPPEVLPEVFDRFARADTSRSRTAGSTGLGLAIVQAVVQAHGGEVGVVSRPGHTVFTVQLPLEPSPADAEQPESDQPGPEPAGESDRSEQRRSSPVV